MCVRPLLRSAGNLLSSADPMGPNDVCPAARWFPLGFPLAAPVLGWASGLFLLWPGSAVPSQVRKSGILEEETAARKSSQLPNHDSTARGRAGRAGQGRHPTNLHHASDFFVSGASFGIYLPSRQPVTRRSKGVPSQCPSPLKRVCSIMGATRR